MGGADLAGRGGGRGGDGVGGRDQQGGRGRGVEDRDEYDYADWGRLIGGVLEKGMVGGMDGFKGGKGLGLGVGG